MVTSMSLTGRLYALAATLLTQLTDTARPMLGQLIGQGKREEAYNVYRQLLLVSGAAGMLVAAAIWAANGAFVSWWVGGRKTTVASCSTRRSRQGWWCRHGSSESGSSDRRPVRSNADACSDGRGVDRGGRGPRPRKDLGTLRDCGGNCCCRRRDFIVVSPTACCGPFLTELRPDARSGRGRGSRCSRYS